MKALMTTTTIFVHRNDGLPGTRPIPASRGGPGCRYRGAPDRRNGAGPPGTWDLGRGGRKGASS